MRSDQVIDFEMNGGKIYRNTLPDTPAPASASRSASRYKTSLNQLCSVDIITVLHSEPAVSRGASCGLGKFQPVTLAAH